MHNRFLSYASLILLADTSILLVVILNAFIYVHNAFLAFLALLGGYLSHPVTGIQAEEHIIQHRVRWAQILRDLLACRSCGFNLMYTS
jgi:hypothetical protein